MKKLSILKLFRLNKLLANFTKRQRTVIGSIVLVIMMLMATFVSIEDSLFFFPIFIFAVYVVTYLTILENINKIERISLFLTPLIFSIIFYLFYFFVPQRWLTRLPFIVFYAVGIYASLLSQNIFNVGVEKTIQLVRAASSINFLILTVVSLVGNIIIYSLDIPYFYIPIIIFLLHLPIIWQFIWSVNPTEEGSWTDLIQSLVVAFLLAQLSIMLLFVPLERSILSLIITCVFYSITGLLQAYLQQRLFKERLREYIGVLIFIGILSFFVVKW